MEAYGINEEMLADDKGFMFKGEEITKFEDILPFVDF